MSQVPQKMRAVDIREGKGPASSLFINDNVPVPSVKPDECLIKVVAFGLNRADTLQREGNYPVPPWASKVMGLEFAGTIAAIGSSPESPQGEAQEDRHHWRVGDEVFGLAYGGCYAEYVAINRAMLLRKPGSIDWPTAAGLPEVWFTALQALYKVGQYAPHTHRSVLWHAGASGVSIAGIQLSRHANDALDSNDLPSHSADAALGPPRVFATARQDDKCAFTVEKLGATAAFNTKKTSEWAKALRDANGGEGVDLIVDYVGADYFQQNLDVLNRDGRVVQLAALSGAKLPAGVDISGFVAKRIRFEGSTLRSRDPAYQGELRDLFEQKVLPGLLSGLYTAHTDTVMSWSNIKEAHEKMERNETKGKIVCLVD